MTRLRRPWWAIALLLAACQTTSGELGGLAELPPVDCAVLVTGGAYLAAESEAGTFASTSARADASPFEVIAIDAVVDVLRQGEVFQRVELDTDPKRRRTVRDSLRAGDADPAVLKFLQQSRIDGFDFVLVVEELQDGPIDVQGTNGRWPLTFATWILLGVGALIPDHTFESRATLRVTLRELTTGRTIHDPLLTGGPIELALVERSDLLGLLESAIVPPFWVGNDPQRVADAVREVTQRRLLSALARDLKSESVRQKLRERAAARVLLVSGDDGQSRITVDSNESLSVARLRGDPALPAGVSEAFERALLASRVQDGERFRYEAKVPTQAIGGRLQVLVGTIRGGVATATFAPGSSR